MSFWPTITEFLNFDLLIQSGFRVLAGVCAVALTCWCIWLIILKALPWVAASFSGWLSDIQKREDWEESGKPYYIQDDDGRYHRVSAMRYENYLLDRGFSPESARSYMEEHAYDPSLKPPEVLRDDDDDDDF